jgi:hypothetical protein
MRRIWRDYNLSIVLTALFLVCWVLQTWMGWVEFAAEQRAHGEVARWLGDSGYFWRWGEATFENWQSEFLQLTTFVVFTAFLIHRGSHESRDGDDELRGMVEEIRDRLERMERAERAGGSSDRAPAGRRVRQPRV